MAWIRKPEETSRIAVTGFGPKFLLNRNRQVDAESRSRLRQILPEEPGRSRGAVQSGLDSSALPRQPQNSLVARFVAPRIWPIEQNSINWKQNTRQLRVPGAPAQDQGGKIANPLRIWVSLLLRLFNGCPCYGGFDSGENNNLCYSALSRYRCLR